MVYRFPFLCIALLLATAWPGFAANTTNALEKYLATPDSSYAWKIVDKRDDTNFSIIRARLTSQRWRDILWEHDLLLVKPAVVRNPDAAFLLISGDGDGSRNIDLLKKLAERAGAPAAVLTRVPNQPLFEGKLNEDALISYTFDQYLKTRDDTWPLLFPMVKSAHRALDAFTAIAAQEWKAKPNRFVVGGASKRGWTTYLTAATHPQIAGIAPMVIDTLNMRAQLKWAEQIYGRQSEQIRDYVDRGLIEQIDAPPMKRLRSWVDPYSYAERYTMPKLLLLGTNDPYWTVDSLRHYWEALPEPKFVYQTPNAGHDLAGGKQASETLAAFFQIIADKEALPKVTWQMGEADGKSTITMNAQPAPSSVTLWSATSPDRDFRNDQWTSSTTAKPVATIDKPESGFRATMVEAEFASRGHKYKLSTGVKVLPDTKPND